MMLYYAKLFIQFNLLKTSILGKLRVKLTHYLHQGGNVYYNVQLYDCK